MGKLLFFVLFLVGCVPNQGNQIVLVCHENKNYQVRIKNVVLKNIRCEEIGYKNE